MTKVRVQVVEMANGPERAEGPIILEIDLREFTQGAQFGECSEAITFAQKVVKAAARQK